MFQPLAGPRVFHSHHFLTRIAAIDRAADPSFAVIGAGQNAIEVLIHLSDHFPRSRITCVQRNNGFRIQDLGHFTNQAYFPEEVDYFHSLPPEGRRRLLDEQKVTNYASVDYDVSRTLYWKMYEEQVRGDEKLRIVRRHEVRGVALEDGRYRLSLADVYLGTPQTVEADVVVLCTGFVEEPAPAAVDALRPHFVLDADGQPEITRGYRVVADGALKPGIFVSGISEKTHGIAEATSFSMMALKAQRVLDGLSALRDARAPASAEVCADTPRRAPIVLAEA
jgi:L-ornithine N5-oxygenase